MLERPTVATLGVSQRLLLALLVCLPVPTLAGSGLALPLPDIVYQVAVGLAERTQAVALRLGSFGTVLTEAVDAPPTGTIVLSSREVAEAEALRRDAARPVETERPARVAVRRPRPVVVTAPPPPVIPPVAPAAEPTRVAPVAPVEEEPAREAAPAVREEPPRDQSPPATTPTPNEPAPPAVAPSPVDAPPPAPPAETPVDVAPAPPVEEIADEKEKDKENSGLGPPAAPGERGNGNEAPGAPPETPPGNSGDAPGQAPGVPGNSGNAPGQSRGRDTEV